MNGIIDQILEMPAQDRVSLARDILDSVVSENETFELTDEQRIELERRIEYSRLHPDEYSSWEEVKHRLLTRG